MKNIWKKSLSLITFALIFSILGAGLVIYLDHSISISALADSVPLATKLEGTLSSPFTAPVQAVKNSVVGVYNYGTVSFGQQADPFGFGFGFGFGSPYGRNAPRSNEEVRIGGGSGVVISESGHILTNYHVIEGGESYKISIEDEEYPAQVIVYDQSLDIAILQADKAKELNPVSIGDSDNLQVGDWAICIGNPLSETFSGTTTVGIVSGLNRKVTSSITDEYGRSYETTNSTMIQVDAAINSGNSGGGMFNILGELVGIPTLKYSSNRFYNSASIEGIGMCIAINDAKPLIEKVLSGEIETPEDYLSREDQLNQDSFYDGKPKIGIRIGNLSPNHPLMMNRNIPEGILIADVEKHSPADEGDLRLYDVIVEANGSRVWHSEELSDIISQLKEGDEVSLKIFRLNASLEDLEALFNNYSESIEIPEGEYIEITITLRVLTQKS